MTNRPSRASIRKMYNYGAYAADLEENEDD